MSEVQSSYVTVEDERPRRRSPVGPVVVVGVLFVLTLVVVVFGVVSTREQHKSRALTIAELRADPERWDDRNVQITGEAANVRDLPVLDQYAIYDFSDDTGTIMVLSQRGAPPDGPVTVRGVFHSQVSLDSFLRAIAEEELGPLAGDIVGALLPDFGVSTVFIEHRAYEPAPS